MIKDFIKNRRKTSISIALIVALISSSLLFQEENTEAFNYSEKFVEVTDVKEMNLVNTYSYSAILEGNRETILSAKMPGQIQNINFDIGDTVKKGAILASLSGNEHFARSSAAADFYKNAKATKEVTILLSQKQINDAKAALKTAEENLNAAKIGLSGHQIASVGKLKTAELEYEKAKTQLENIEKQYSQQEENTWENRETAIINAAILNKNLVNSLYSINDLSLTENNGNFLISDDFIVGQQLKINTQNSIKEYRHYTEKLEKFYNEEIKDKTPSQETLLKGDQLAQEVLGKAKIALQDMTEILSKSFDHSDLPLSTLNEYRTTVSTFAGQVQSLILSQQNGTPSGLSGIQQVLKNLQIEKQNQLLLAEKQMEIAEENVALTDNTLDTTEQELKARVQISQAQLNQAKNALETIKAQADHQLALMQTQVDTAKGEMNIAGSIASNTRISAPFSGIIAEKYVDEGTLINPGTPVLKIADVSRLKLALYIPESQIRLFHIGQTGTSMTDNFPGKEFQISVDKIAPQVDPETRKIRIELKMLNPDSRLKIGMYLTVKLDLIEEDGQSSIVVPLNALQKYYEETSVFVLENGRVERRIVKTGTTSEEFVEILDGLSIGEKVVIKGADNLSDGDKVTTKSNE